MKPGISMSGSLTLTQKCGGMERLSLKTRQQTPTLGIASYFAFQSSGRVGAIFETSGVGTVEMTASAGIKPLGVSTPVMRPSCSLILRTGVEVQIEPPRERM